MALSDTQRGALEQQLEALVEALEAALASSEAAARPVELDPPAVGRVSRVDAMQQQEMVAAGRQAQRARLQQVRAALQRLSEDEYGECASCGEDIGFARLEVRPESLFCVTCQGARERR